jgi:hypothetical protein
MTSAPNRRKGSSTEALESVREAVPEPDDEDLVEHQPVDESPEALQQPLHNPLWA